METFFLEIYRFFQKRKKLMFATLAILLVAMGFFASRISFQEDIMRFIPNTTESKNICAVFQNLKVKDKIVVLLSSKERDTDRLINIGEQLTSEIEDKAGSHIAGTISKIDSEKMSEVCNYIYGNIPIFLDSTDYASFDSLTSRKNISERLKTYYAQLNSPVSFFTQQFTEKDPLGLYSHTLANLQTLQVDGNYTIISDHVFSKADSTLIITISPKFPASNTADNSFLVSSIEEVISKYEKAEKDISFEYFGGPVISVYNAKQIQTDIYTTLGVALAIILVVILISFRNKSSILLMLVPVLFGGLFAMSLIYFIKGSISLIAIGAGSAVLGVVLSYSIHVIAHREHISDKEQIIKEMAQPLTIGSFTTIGAFFSLTFTHSEVLQDFGWFSTFTIIGTTLFCLVFLPHLLPSEKKDERPNRCLEFIEKINSYNFDRNVFLLILIAVLSLWGLYNSDKVKFNPDMNALSFQPENFKRTEEKLDKIFQKDFKTVYLVAVGDDENESFENYRLMNNTLRKAKEDGLISDFANAECIAVSPVVQKERISRWNSYWTPQRIEQVKRDITDEGAKLGFTEEAFAPFFNIIEKQYQPVANAKSNILNDWITIESDVAMAISQVKMKEEHKEALYSLFKEHDGVVILDKPYFMSSFMNVIKSDFYFVLFISSFIVFFALLLSYGRIETALITFLPMSLSWLIILGLMALFGLEFNIVSIIISTFIFGIGDDFSIFITDGLQADYKYGKKVLSAHKTAIFFSAFSTIVGMGALAFAKHPSLQSVSITSIVGMFAVVLIAYTIQPLAFRILITSRTKRGLFPFSFVSVLLSTLAVGTFVLCTVVLTPVALLLKIIPINKKLKKDFLHYAMMYSCKLTLFMAFRLKIKRENLSRETFEKPAVIIANHQSVLDMVNILSISPKIVMMVKGKVYRHPVLGLLLRSANFFCIDDGYEICAEELQKMVKMGYSLAIFPEGKRSQDGTIGRFHKGAFFIAEKLNLDIVPIILTGNHHGIEKGDMFFVKPALMTLAIYDRIKAGDLSWGCTYQERKTSVAKFCKAQYEERKQLSENPQSPYYKYKLTRNYIYKGPVLEWYLRVKVAMEKNYSTFDKLIPKKAKITDIGCGYGFLAYMLNFFSKERTILGIDYDEEKVCVANNCFSKNDNVNFAAADASALKLEQSDVFIMNDMLHYMPYEKQDLLITNCMQSLNDGGIIIIRDGNSSNTDKHGVTKFTEVLSTKIFRFNKAEQELHFTSSERICDIATKHNFKVEEIKNDEITSNTIYILSHN